MNAIISWSIGPISFCFSFLDSLVMKEAEIMLRKPVKIIPFELFIACAAKTGKVCIKELLLLKGSKKSPR